MAEENSILDNIEIHKDFAIISVNPKLYPLSIIYSAAYWLLDKVHVIIDGDPDTEILIEIRPKKDEKNVDLKEVGYQFNDELINYSVYAVQAAKNKKLRELIVENALAGNLREHYRNEPPVNTRRESQRCDCEDSYQDRKLNYSSLKPGEQPFGDDDISKLKRTAKNQDFFQKDILRMDTENISSVRNYRNKPEEFDRAN